jgi:hypothetical protein
MSHTSQEMTTDPQQVRDDQLVFGFRPATEDTPVALILFITPEAFATMSLHAGFTLDLQPYGLPLELKIGSAATAQQALQELNAVGPNLKEQH